MKSKIAIVLLIVLGIGVAIVSSRRTGTTPTLVSNQIIQAKTDEEAIRAFTNKPNLELKSLGEDLPTIYFRVGKVTKVGNGENMEKVDGWVRQVNVYDEKTPLSGGCYVYEYQVDPRNHTLTSVFLKGLHQNEIEALKNQGVTCVANPTPAPKVSRQEAETLAMEYLQRTLPNFNEIKDQFTYSSQNNGESHQWLWENKDYNLPEGLSARPYQYPIIRISVYGNNEVQYWNTVSFFQQ
ncbi:MAG: hypothetical protein UT89_C0006G0010 [Parcubacteria group bacterium GW2011_GWE1_40_20]|nr:MAG: hypothetical protein UT89_C0006G0010 [Parcubacteria group bacterium GW2011_GWE1_40_20]